jgi:ankyrin repeat protein
MASLLREGFCCDGDAAGQYDLARTLIERGADIDVQDRDGFTPLHLACAAGYVATARCTDGWTPLRLACRADHYDLALVLAELGADIDAKLARLLIERGADAKDKETTLFAACRDGKCDLALELIKRGAGQRLPHSPPHCVPE